MNIYHRLIFFFIFCGAINFKARCCNQNQNSVNNIVAFCKLYGYVRYFHPSDEAAQIDWDQFAIWGVNKIKDLPENELMSCFNAMFNPIAPTVQFSTTAFPSNCKSLSVSSGNHGHFKTTSWQHFGVHGSDISSPYKSNRINRPTNFSLFYQTAKIGDCINDKLNEHLYCDVPLCLYIKDSATFPIADAVKLISLKNELATINSNDTSLNNRIAGVIITWNLIQHFYPYREKMDHWDESLIDAIVRCYTDKTVDDFIITLNMLLSHINDGHAFAGSKASPPNFLPPLNWQYIHDTLIISEIFDTTVIKDLSVGDVVININNELPSEIIERRMKTKSASTLRYRKFLAVFSLLKGEQNSIIQLKTINKKGEIKNVEVRRSVSMPFYWKNYMSPNPEHKIINDSTIYINFSKASMKDIDSLMPIIEKEKFIICDLRGYPNGNHGFLSHLLTIDDTANSWFRIPEIIFPNYKNVTYNLSGWNLRKSLPKLNSRVIFIVDQDVISYGESFMSIVENYKLGVIVGDSTAGTNGNVNTFNLPFNGTIIKFTGMNATKLNGSKLVGVGIIPQVIVKPSIQGIILHKDELLDKAIEISLDYQKYKG
jgi:C-terminal processing protease CtpA/Prc